MHYFPLAIRAHKSDLCRPCLCNRAMGSRIAVLKMHVDSGEDNFCKDCTVNTATTSLRCSATSALLFPMPSTAATGASTRRAFHQKGRAAGSCGSSKLGRDGRCASAPRRPRTRFWPHPCDAWLLVDADFVGNTVSSSRKRRHG
jgi:hypothetical protein